jgi:transcriptional repressor NrdR
VEKMSLLVSKRSGVLETFDREKIVNGVRKAFQGRSISDDSLKMLAQTVENEIRARSSSTIDSYDIGLAILEPLKALDKIAYVRFASVYQNFNSLDDFEKAIKELKKQDSDIQKTENKRAK